MYVHPELVEVLASLPEKPLNPDVETTRAGFKALMAPRMGADPRVTVEHAVVGGTIPIQVIRPAGGVTKPGTVLYIHGGGFAYGELDGPSPMARDACVATGATVVNVHYRLAPEHPFPAGIEDCYAVLEWIGDGPIAVIGASAGGCLSAALCLMARDRGGPEIAFQGLLIPCLDDREVGGSRRRITDRRFTNGPAMARTWDTYLGAGRGDDVSPYAAPARATDLSGLPAAYVLTCGLDPLRDEGLDYARRLMEADVPVEVAHVPGAWHLFEAFAPESELARRTTGRWLSALSEGLRVGSGK